MKYSVLCYVFIILTFWCRWNIAVFIYLSFPSSCKLLFNMRVFYYRKAYNIKIADGEQPLLLHRPKKKQLPGASVFVFCWKSIVVFFMLVFCSNKIWRILLIWRWVTNNLLIISLIACRNFIVFFCLIYLVN